MKAQTAIHMPSGLEIKVEQAPVDIYDAIRNGGLITVTRVMGNGNRRAFHIPAAFLGACALEELAPLKKTPYKEIQHP